MFEKKKGKYVQKEEIKICLGKKNQTYILKKENKNLIKRKKAKIWLEQKCLRMFENTFKKRIWFEKESKRRKS